MAAALQCEICGGKLVGKPGGIFECDSCGMEYSTELAKAKIQEIKGTVKVEGTVAKFSTNGSEDFHKPAEGYTPDVLALIHRNIKEDGRVTIPWGRSVIKLYDTRARQNRMIRLRFAIGYAKPVEHGRGKVNVLNLVSNLAEFSVVYNPRANTFTLSR